jgi:tRNA-dihydrouridine synthase A
VQRGAFGACLMAEPDLVADCVAAMREVVDVPVTVKHRIGVDRVESYDFVRDFVGTVAERGGCQVFVVHARNAWLQGLSPKENREIPPLRHEFVHRLALDFADLVFVVNGGITQPQQVAEQLAHVDGVMVGREAYHNPWSMARWDDRFLGAPDAVARSREEVEEAMVAYMEREQTVRGTPWRQIARHMLGLRNGLPGARRWRQVWSDHRHAGLPAREVWAIADRAAREGQMAALA